MNEAAQPQVERARSGHRWLIVAFAASAVVAAVLTVQFRSSGRSSTDLFARRGIVEFVLLPHILALQVMVPFGAMAAMCSACELETRRNRPHAGRSFSRVRPLLFGCLAYAISIALMAAAGQSGMFGFAAAGLIVLFLMFPSLAVIVGITAGAVLQLGRVMRDCSARPPKE